MPVEKLQKWCKECECHVPAERLIDRKFSPGGVLGGTILFGAWGALFGAVSEKRGKAEASPPGDTRLLLLGRRPLLFQPAIGAQRGRRD
jgi:hypothetical protein